MINTLIFIFAVVFVTSMVAAMVGTNQSDVRRSRFLRQIRNSAGYTTSQARQFRDELLREVEGL